MAPQREQRPDSMARERAVQIEYTNHRGVFSTRTIIPFYSWFGSTQYHPTPQWLLHAWCMDQDARRDFAHNEITKWTDRPLPPI